MKDQYHFNSSQPSQQCSSLPVAQEVYEIRVREYLDERWSEWFDDWAISHEKNGATLLRGPVSDQAALYGIIAKISNLNLTIKSILSIRLDSADVIQNSERRESITR